MSRFFHTDVLVWEVEMGGDLARLLRGEGVEETI